MKPYGIHGMIGKNYMSISLGGKKMLKEVIMPKIGLDMEEGTILTWLKKIGDPVETGEALAEIETDKATTEVESAVSGTLKEIVEEEGAVVEIAKTIAWIETNE